MEVILNMIKGIKNGKDDDDDDGNRGSEKEKTMVMIE